MQLIDAAGSIVLHGDKKEEQDRTVHSWLTGTFYST
jgi:hypothetical protein